MLWGTIMVELIYCKKCRTEKELRYIGDEVVSETPCKCFIKPKFDNDYMVKVVKEIAEELTRKANVTSKRIL